jgi:hypothetical protein
MEKSPIDILESRTAAPPPNTVSTLLYSESLTNKQQSGESGSTNMMFAISVTVSRIYKRVAGVSAHCPTVITSPSRAKLETRQLIEHLLNVPISLARVNQNAYHIFGMLVFS